MADLASITGLITAAGSVIGLANKANTVEANQKIIELQQRMAEVQQGFAELFQENQTLKEENRKLKDEIAAEAMYPLRESVRWKKSADGSEDDGPFCPICFAKDKILMPLSPRRPMRTAGIFSFECPQHHPGGDVIYAIEMALIKKGKYRYPE